MFFSYLCIDYVNVCVVEFYLYFAITNLSRLWNLQKIVQKGESSSQVHFMIFFSYFGMDLSIYVIVFWVLFIVESFVF